MNEWIVVTNILSYIKEVSEVKNGWHICVCGTIRRLHLPNSKEMHWISDIIETIVPVL